MLNLSNWVLILLFFRKRGKKGEKNGKGLRHFSMKVCEKVQRKGVTTYNEVADELVAEFSSGDNHISPNDAVSHPEPCLLSSEVKLLKPIKDLLLNGYYIMT